MGNSDYLRDLVLRRTLLDPEQFDQLYVSLHRLDPGDEGLGEVAGGGYQRQLLRLRRSGPGMAVNANTIEYDDMPQTQVTHFGVWDNGQDGRFLTGGILLVAHSAQAGQALRWRESELVLRVG